MSIKSEAVKGYKYTPTFSSNRWYRISKLIRTMVHNEPFVILFLKAKRFFYRNHRWPKAEPSVIWFVKAGYVLWRGPVNVPKHFSRQNRRSDDRGPKFVWFLAFRHSLWTIVSKSWHLSRFSLLKNINGIKYLWRLVIVSKRGFRDSLRLMTNC